MEKINLHTHKINLHTQNSIESKMLLNFVFNISKIVVSIINSWYLNNSNYNYKV